MPYRLTVRVGPRVRKLRHDSLTEAVERLLVEARVLAGGEGRRAAVRTSSQTYEPAQLVGARLEVRGPQRLFPNVRAGIDIRGDGSVEAWTGSAQRALVEPHEGEDAYAALRRLLLDQRKR